MQLPGPSDTPARLDAALIARVFETREAELIGALHQSWLDARVGDVPPRSSIDPATMRYLLPDIALMEYDAVRQDWRYALVGERVREMIGGEVKGRMLGDVLAATGDELRVGQFYRDTASWRHPTLTFGRHTVGYATHEVFARLLYPYRGQGEDIDTLLLILIRLGCDDG